MPSKQLGYIVMGISLPAWLSFHPARDRERDTGGDGLIRVSYQLPLFRSYPRGGGGRVFSPSLWRRIHI